MKSFGFIAGVLLAVSLLSGGTAAEAVEPDYQLKPEKVAADTWMLRGKEEDFSFTNGGNIVNTGFVVTDQGVLVIDTGPTRLYGEQLKAAIAKVTDRPIVRVINTHHHPDHMLGNQAFGAALIEALPVTVAGIRGDGDAFANNVYRMSGDWAKGTEVVVPGRTSVPGRFTLGGHDMELIALAGHTQGDLVLFDHSTATLFTGDLVFYQRCPTTPHAQISTWLAALDSLQKIPFKVLVPGHGPVLNDAKGIEQTRRWLAWLSSRLQQAARSGAEMAETMAMALPPEFADLPLARSEYERSVAHLFRSFEEAELKPAATHPQRR